MFLFSVRYHATSAFCGPTCYPCLDYVSLCPSLPLAPLSRGRGLMNRRFECLGMSLFSTFFPFPLHRPRIVKVCKDTSLGSPVRFLRYLCFVSRPGSIVAVCIIAIIVSLVLVLCTAECRRIQSRAWACGESTNINGLYQRPPCSTIVSCLSKKRIPRNLSKATHRC